MLSQNELQSLQIPVVTANSLTEKPVTAETIAIKTEEIGHQQPELTSLKITDSQTTETDFTHFSHAPVNRDAERIVDGVLKTSHRLRSVLADHFAEFGLTDIRYSVLQILRNASPEGCTQAELADELAQSESSVCTLVKRMRDSELLYRLRSKTDQRKWGLHITDRGRQLLEQVDACHGKRVTNLLSTFSKDDLSRLANLLEQFLVEISQPVSQVLPIEQTTIHSASTDTAPTTAITPDQQPAHDSPAA